MPVYIEKPALNTIQINIKADSKDAFIDWQAKFNVCIANAAGFVSLEFSSPSSQQQSWFIVQRFANSDLAAAWHGSEAYACLLQELKPLAMDDSLLETTNDPSSTIGNVTEVLVTEVDPDKQAAYSAWCAKIHQVEAKFPGFRGVYVQAPGHGKKRHWITLLQFDTMENLDHWLQSPERAAVLRESTSLIYSLESHRVISPYAGWFASIAKTGELPPVWKQTMLVLLVLFPIVMLELKYLSPLTASLGGSLATFIGNALSVTLISFPAMPLAIRCLDWWLAAHDRTTSSIGAGVVALLYLIEIFIFWDLL